MGFGMAAMAVPAAVVHAAALGLARLRGRLRRRRRCARCGRPGAAPHHLHHLVGASAMVYMALAMAAAPAAHHAGHGGSGGLPAASPGCCCSTSPGTCCSSGVRLIPVPVAAAGGPSAAAGPGWGDRPELARACRLSMGIAMVAMLLTHVSAVTACRARWARRRRSPVSRSRTQPWRASLGATRPYPGARRS